jgi:PAS domain S-box-containing protein
MAGSVEHLALLDAVPDAIVLVDVEGTIVFANRAALVLFGYAAPELLGGPAARLVPERYRGGREGLERITDLPTGARGYNVRIHGLRRDGTEFQLETSIARADLEDAPVVVATFRETADGERDQTVHRLAKVVESSPDAVLTKDLSGIITSWNRGAERMYGYTAEEAIGRPVSMLMDAERAHEMGEILQAIGRGHEVESLETVRVNKGGRAIEVSVSVSPLRDARGVIVGAATVARDITERKREDERVRALLESAPDAVVVVGAEGRMVLVNRQTEELFGYAREALLGRPADMLIPERLREVDAYHMGYFLSPETRQTGAALELRGQRADGSEFPVEITFSPLRTDEGLLVYASIRDITERKLIEEELRRSNHDLEQFAYVASHDLSEPLRVIAGFTDLLARRYSGALDKDADKFINFIVSGVERMQTLIDDLLAYSRAGRAQLAVQQVDAGDVVRDVLWALEPQLTAQDVRVEVGELPRVCAEPTALRQIFQNLISNAVKFSDNAEPLVQVSARRLPNGWRFDVKDNGPGVEPRHAERVFELFQRLHGREVEGSGMGLAIVKRLTERHGGQVWVTPAEPCGSVFTFTIPDPSRTR